uniref:Putative secreted protein n=1 Tax=Amblyomma triste TaxID=251400 RepID=A0A023G117_AMBTT
MCPKCVAFSLVVFLISLSVLKSRAKQWLQNMITFFFIHCCSRCSTFLTLNRILCLYHGCDTNKTALHKLEHASDVWMS